MAPSPPSVRSDDPALGAVGEDLAAGMSVLSVLEEDKGRTASTPVGSGMDGLYKNEIPAQRPAGIGADDPANINWSYMDPTGNEQGKW